MQKKEKVIITTFVVTFTIISFIAVVLLSDNSTNLVEEPPAKEAKKALVDGDMSNIEETLSAQRIYKNYRIKALRIAEQGPYYTIIFMVDNLSKTVQEHSHLNFAFLDSNDKLLNEISIEIPELQPGQTQQVYQYGTSKSLYNAFDYTISEKKK